jgi:hypothetical protein
MAMKRQNVCARVVASVLLALLAACSGAPAVTSTAPPLGPAAPASPTAAAQAVVSRPATWLALRLVHEPGKLFRLAELEVNTDGIAVNPVDPQNLWGEYKSISAFLQDENLAALAPSKAHLAPEGATALVLQSNNRALAWVRSDAYDVAPANAAYQKARQAGQAGGDWVYQPPAIEGMRLTVSGLADGAYIARWFEPNTAEWLDEQALRVRDGTATLELPRFAQDLAVKIVGAPTAQ